MNDALQTGLLDFASGGPTPLLKMWDRNAGAFGIKGVCALSTMPIYLNTVDPDVRTLADLNDSDRIALPRVKESLQAVILQMAAAREFGENSFNALDRLTVSMAHPEAMAAMLSGQSGITSHFASPPFQYQELDDSRVRTLVSSYDVLGGPTTFTVLWTRTQFYYENPNTFRAIVAALAEAVDFINANPRGAADIYRQQSNVNLAISSIETILTDPLIEFTLTPANIMPLAKFMRRTGAIKRSPESRRELFLAGDGITN